MSKWIKLNIDMFDQWQIKELRSLPEGDTAVVVYMYLLMQAVRSNHGGMLVFNEHIPITTASISNQLSIKERTVEMAIKALIQLELITDIDGILNVVGINDYTYTDPASLLREQNRERQRRYRERHRHSLIENKTDDTELPVLPAINSAKEVITATKQEEAVSKEDIQKVIDSWNAMAERAGLKKLTRLTAGSNRYKWLKARMIEYGTDDVLKAINLIPDCTYVLDKGWFNFEWFVRPSNFPKVLEGNYLNKGNDKKEKRVYPAIVEPTHVEDPELSYEEWVKIIEDGNQS